VNIIEQASKLSIVIRPYFVYSFYTYKKLELSIHKYFIILIKHQILLLKIKENAGTKEKDIASLDHNFYE